MATTKTTTDWVDIFDALEIAWCYGQEDCPVPRHLNGTIEHDPNGMVIHWFDRRMTRPSIHKVLRLIARESRPDLKALPPWRGTFLLNEEILLLARKAHVRLPRTVFDLDRARLRYLLSEYNSAERRRMSPSEQRDFTAALRWAARS